MRQIYVRSGKKLFLVNIVTDESFGVWSGSYDFSSNATGSGTGSGTGSTSITADNITITADSTLYTADHL